MIPFRDNIPSRSFPIMTISIILVNVLVFFYEISLGRAVEPLIEQYGLTPAAVFAWPGSDIPLVAIALPFLTSMFLHGGWLHLIGNMWYLWIFGDNIEDRLGHSAFVVFYLLSGLSAGIVAWWAHVGGFVIGMVLIGLFPRKDRQRYDYYPRT